MGLISSLSEIFSSRRLPAKVDGSIYDFEVKSLAGKAVDLTQYKGKHMLIVNTASKCGYTPQYADLQKLHEQYGDKVAVLGFPANNFLWQEPGSSDEISSFCEINYGVSFPLFEKVSVKGRKMHPLFRWLAAKSGHKPSWNFCKYLVEPNGNSVEFFPSTTNPLDQQIVGKIAG